MVAEGAWLSVVYLALQGATGGGAHPLGLVPMSGVVAIGILLARTTERWRRSTEVFVVAVVMAAALGVMASAAARDQVGAGIAVVLGAHIGGLVLGLALVRGYSYRDVGDSEDVIDRLLRVGALGLIVPWVIGLSLAEPARSDFITAAFFGTVIFVGAALVALAGARLRALGDEAGFDWRAGRAWLGTVSVVVIALIILMVPSAFILGAPVSVAIRELIAPVVIFLWSIPVAAGSIVATLLSPFFGFVGPMVFGFLSSVQGMLGTAQPPTQTSPSAAGGGLPWIPEVVLAGVLLFVAWLLRRIARRRKKQRAAAVDDPSDRRSVVIPIALPHPHLPRFHIPGVHRAPRDAVAAYLRVLDEMALDTELARRPEETPHDHALRLRPSARAGLALDLLAADYELARFGAVALTPAENRRAIGRWRRLRPG